MVQIRRYMNKCLPQAKLNEKVKDLTSKRKHIQDIRGWLRIKDTGNKLFPKVKQNQKVYE